MTRRIAAGWGFIVQDITGVVTRKGQVTIPSGMRRALGISEGDRVVFRLEDGVVVLRPATTLVAQLIGSLRAMNGATAPTDDEFHEAVAAGFAEDEEAHMEDLGLEPAVRGCQRAAEGDPAGSSGALPSGHRAA